MVSLEFKVQLMFINILVVGKRWTEDFYWTCWGLHEFNFYKEHVAHNWSFVPLCTLIIPQDKCSPGNFIRIFFVLNSFINYRPDNCSEYCIWRSEYPVTSTELLHAIQFFQEQRQLLYHAFASTFLLLCMVIFIIGLFQSILEYTEPWYGNGMYYILKQRTIDQFRIKGKNKTSHTSTNHPP